MKFLTSDKEKSRPQGRLFSFSGAYAALYLPVIHSLYE